MSNPLYLEALWPSVVEPNLRCLHVDREYFTEEARIQARIGRCAHGAHHIICGYNMLLDGGLR